MLSGGGAIHNALLHYLFISLVVISPSFLWCWAVVAEDDNSQILFHAAVLELVTPDPRCYYRMLDAVIRRHARRAALVNLRDFWHPADVEAGLAGLSSKQQGVDTGSMDTSSTRDQGDSFSDQCMGRSNLAGAMGVTAIAAGSGASQQQLHRRHQQRHGQWQQQHQQRQQQPLYSSC